MKRIFSKHFSFSVKLIGTSLVLLSAFSLSSCKKKPAEPSQNNSAKIGLLTQIGMSEDDVKQWTSDVAAAEGKQTPYHNPNTLIQYDSLDSMVMALKTGSIDRFSIGFQTANYIVSQNSDFALIDKHHKPIMGYSIATTENHKDLIDSINAAIDTMKANGTLNSLIDKYLTNASENMVSVELPSIAGAPTINIGITGDLPPMDYILPDVTPAGFNTAFLSELSKCLNVNFNLVDISSGARSLAISSGKIDALFWVIGSFDSEGNSIGLPLDKTENLIISKPYFQDRRAAVKRADK